MKTLALSWLSLVFKAWKKGRLALPRRSAAVFLAATATWSSAATLDWEGATGGTPGDGLFWSNPLNWQGDVLPTNLDDVTFGAPGTGGSTVHLDANRTINSLAFDESITIGAAGTGLTLTNATGNVAVAAGAVAQINGVILGTSGLNVSGGGTLHLWNPLNNWTGNIAVSGAGTRLQFAYPGQPTPTSRSNALPLSQQNQTITLSNGGELRLLGSGYNPDGTIKNLVLGTGGGALNVAAGFQQMSVDDASQISGAGSLTKNGNGRLTIGGGNDYALAGGVVVNGGLLDFTRILGGSTTGGTRWGAFAAGAPITVNGGLATGNSGTAGVWDGDVTLNGGALAVQGSDQGWGSRTTARAITLNGGAILARDAFNPAGQRFTRVHGALAGSGTIDIIGSTNAGGNPRVVFEWGDAAAHTFNGTYVIRENAAIENNPRYGGTANVGNAIGNATIDLRGFFAQADLRDNGAGSNTNLSSGESNWNGVAIRVSGMDAGGIQRLNVNQSTAGNTGNVFHMRDLAFTGNQRLAVTGGNSYGSRFDTLTLSGGSAIVPMLDTVGARVEINGAISENAAGSGIVKRGNDALNLSGATGLSSYSLNAGTLRLFGANGALNAGTLSGTGRIAVNGSSGPGHTAGTLVLDNNFGNTGGSVPAANSGNRLNDGVPLTMTGNGILRLVSLNNQASTETTGNVSVPFGQPTVDVSRTGTSPAPVVFTLGALPPVIGGTAGGIFSGAGLGAAGNNSSRIVIPLLPTTGFLGANLTSGNEWVRYDATVDSGAPLGVIPWTNADYGAGLDALETAWVAGMHVKQTGAAGLALTGPRTAESLNLQFSATGQAVSLGGNTLTLAGGGVLSGVNTAGITGAGPTDVLTSGTRQIVVTNNAQLDVNAVIADGPAGATTLVKNGTGTLRLTNQTTGVAAPAGALGATTHTNSFSGGVVINNGVLDVHRAEYLGSGSSVTMGGGALLLNIPLAPPSSNTGIVPVGKNLVVEANSRLIADNNGEATDANAANNIRLDMGSLTVNNGAIFGFGAWNGVDVKFSGATFSGTPVLNTNVDVGDNAGTLIIDGALTGSGFTIDPLSGANAGRVGRVMLGGGAGDAIANTYTGTITLQKTSASNDGVLTLNKANGTTAVTGDIIINNGTLTWGPGQVGTDNSHITENSNAAVVNRFSGNSLVSAIYGSGSGQHQIADSATITLLNGTLNESARLVDEKFAALNQRNGTFNTGVGTIEVNTYNMWGGNLAYNSGGVFKAGTAVFHPGAPDISVANNFSGGPSVLEIGTGGLTLNQQNITLGNASYLNAAGGAVLKLSGDFTQNYNPLNGSTVRAIQTGGGGRELAVNNIIDLQGGNRTFTIDRNVFQQVHGPVITNGGITLAGGGTLSVQPWNPNTFAGGVTVQDGIYLARGASAFGGGTVVVQNGGTAKLDGGWAFANGIVLSGPGSFIPGESGPGGMRELGALVAQSGGNVLTGNVSLAGGATIASDNQAQPSTATIVNTAIASASPLAPTSLDIRNAVTGTGTLTLTGGGNGMLRGGLNTTGGGLVKSGSGVWAIGRASSYDGATTVEAGTLVIMDGGALGSTLSGTTVLGGSTLATVGGITSGEPLTLRGDGVGGLAGAVRSMAGTNTFSAPVLLGSPTAMVRADAGRLVFGGPVTGAGTQLGVSGAGAVLFNGAVTSNGMLKIGSGDAVLSAAGNSFGTGSLQVLGGRLSLSSGLTALNDVVLAGSLVNTGASQNMGNLTLSSAGAMLSGGSGFVVGTFTRPAGTAVGFSGTVDVGAASVAGWAYAGSDFAKKAGTNVVAMSGGDYTLIAAPSGAGAAPSISDPTQTTLYDYGVNGYASPAFGTLSSGGLKVASGVAGLATGSNAVTLAGGGLLVTGSGNFNIGGTGLVSGNTPGDDLIIHAQRNVAVSNPLIGAGNGNLVKTGSGTLTLFGASEFTGSVNVGGGMIGVLGQQPSPGPLGGALTGANRVINLDNGGGLSLVTGSWDLNDYDPVTGGVQSLVINVGAGGGVLHSRDGQLLINDTNGQFGGVGDLTISGGGRVQIDQNYTFAGDTRVTGGTLRLGASGALGSSPVQKVTMAPGTAIILGAALPTAYEFEGATIHPVGGDRQFLAPVSFSGTNRIVLAERDALNNARSLAFSNTVSGSGVLDFYSTGNANGRVQLSASNTFAGTINLNANTVVEARVPGALGQNDGDVTINVLGANAGVRTRHYLNGDYRANLNVQANAEFQFGRHENYGQGSQQLATFNNLTVGTGTRWLNLNGDNNYWFDIKGTATAAGNVVINQNNPNMLLENGMTVAGTFNKRGGNVLATRGPLVADKVVISSGPLDLRGNGTITAPGGVELRGGQLIFSQGVDGISNPNRYTGPLTLGGGVLRVTGTTNLGTVTAAPGQTDVVYNSDSQGNSQTPLVLTGFTRSTGAHINFATDYGIVGRESTTNSNPRIHLPGQADTFGTGAVGSVDIIPWGRLGNEFAGYRTQTDLGVALGVFPVTNTFMVTDPAEGAFAAANITRLTGTATTTMTASRSVRALKMDGGATRTIDIGAANTLTVDRGAIIHVGAGSNRIGVAATGGKLQAGAGVSEFHLTSNANTLLVGAGIQDNGAAVTLVKNGAGALEFDGTAATSANTFTGGIHLNAGLFVNRATTHIPSNTTIQFNGGRWEPRIDPGATTGGSINLSTVNLVVNASSLSLGGDPALSLDNGTTAANINGTYQLGRVTINNGATWSVAGWDQMDATFTASGGGAHQMNSSGGIAPTIELFQGRTATAAGEALMTFAGPITGDAGLFITSRGNRAGTNPSDTVLVLGGGASDTTHNNFGGPLEAGVTHNGSNFGAPVRLNKAAGFDAVGAQGLIIGAATVRSDANEQINDAAAVVINGYASSAASHGWNLSGRTETIGSLTQNGGVFISGAGTLNVTDAAGGSGRLSVIGGGAGNTGDVFQMNSGATVSAKSVELIRYGRIVLGGGVNTVLNIGSGGLVMEGTQIHLNNGAATNSRVVLGGDVTTLASPSPAALTTQGDTNKRLDLGGAVRAFNVADGSAGDDLAVNLAVENGGIYKTGSGTMVLGGSSLFHSNALNASAGGANTFTGDTTVSSGALHLNKAPGTNALGSAKVFVGDGNGPTALVLRASNQIPDATELAMDSQATLDLGFANTSEAVGNLSSAAGGRTLLGPTSVLTTTVTADTTYAGSILGGGDAAGAVIKNGAAKWTLSGSSEYAGDTLVNGGTLEVSGFLNGTTTRINAGGTLSGTGIVSDVVVNAGGTLAPGTSPGVITTRNLATTLGSTSAFEIGGLAPGNGSSFHDQVRARGTVSLDGTLTVSLVNAFEPAVNDEFILIDNDGTDLITGNFSLLPEGSTIPQPTGAEPLGFWWLRYGRGTDSNDFSITYVPEPGSTLTAAAAGLAFALRRRRRAA